MSQQEKPTAVRLRERAWILLVFGVLVGWLVGIGGISADSTALNVLGYAGIIVGVGMVAWAVWLFTNRRP